MDDARATSHHEENPYRSPAVEDPVAIPALSQAETIRREHLNHESSIKAIGGLYLLGAGVWAFMGGGLLFAMFLRGAPVPNQSLPIAGATILFLAVFLFLSLGATGVGLRLLRPWGKWASAVISFASLVWGVLQTPGIGVILSAYVLYLLFCKKGRMVFSSEYQQIVRETPHIRVKTSVITWFVLALFVIGLITFLGYAVLFSPI